MLLSFLPLSCKENKHRTVLVSLHGRRFKTAMTVLFMFNFQGCSERVEYFEKNPPAWSAFRSSDYGYTRMNFLNKTHLYVEQVSDDKVR